MKEVTEHDPISVDDLRRMAAARFGDLVKAVVDWLEFDSMINVRPSFGNRSRGVGDSATRERIATLVNALVRR